MSTTTAPDETNRSRTRPPGTLPRVWALLVAILLVAGYVRTLSLTSWDGTSYLHPDERFLIFTAYNLRVPQSVGDYFRSSCGVNGAVPNASNPGEAPERQEPTLASGCNTLNPRNYNWSRFFVYGTLPTTLTRVVAEALLPLKPEGERVVTPEDVRNIGRTLSTLFDLGSVLLVFLIGRRLYDERVALLGSFLLAVAALPIQLSHFFTVDAATAFFVLLAVYWAVRGVQGGGVFSFTMLGVSIGAAMACRFTMATLGLLGMVAVMVRLLPARAEGREQRAEASLSLRKVASLFALLSLAGAVSLLSWRVLQPDAFVGTSFFDVHLEPRFVRNVEEIGAIISGEADSPPAQQWANRTPFVFALQNMVIWGMGLPLGIAAWAAWAAAGWQLLRRRALQHAIPWIWIAFYFAWQGGGFVMTMRYYGLLYGLLALLAAWGLFALARRAEGGERRADDATEHSAFCPQPSALPRRNSDGAVGLCVHADLHRAALAHPGQPLDLPEHPAWLGDHLRGVGRRAAAQHRRPGLGPLCRRSHRAVLGRRTREIFRLHRWQWNVPARYPRPA